MADTNIGFDVQNGLLEGDWAVLSPHLGSTLAVVDSEASRKVTASTSNPGTVDVAPGVTYAFGERHATDTTVNKTIADVSLSGAQRWDAIVERRNWSTNSVTIEVVQGTPSVNAPEVAPTLNATPGQTFDQLLSLVKATQGSTARVVSDKRVWASKVFTVATLASLPTAGPALYGAVCYVVDTKVVYRCLLVAGTPSWVASTPTRVILSGADVISPSSGWVLTSSNPTTQNPNPPSLACRGVFDPSTGLVQIDLQLRRSSGTISPYNSGGGVPVTDIGTLADVLKPDADVDPTPVPGQYSTGSSGVNNWRGAEATLSAAGALKLVQIGSDDLVPPASGPSLRMHLTFFKRI